MSNIIGSPIAIAARLASTIRDLVSLVSLVAVHGYDRVHFGPEHGVNTPCSFVFTPETAETLCLCSLCVHFGTEHKCNTMCSFTLPCLLYTSPSPRDRG